jgi:sugar phosphate isomerase/epimerase
VRVGLFTDGLGHLPLEAALDWLDTELPDVKDLEIGTGGFSPTPHCDAETLLADPAAAGSWLQRIEERGFRVVALNANGNPLEEAGHDRGLRTTIALAAALDIDTVACMSGGRPELSGGAWFPGVEDAVDAYWTGRVLPYWREVAGLAEQQAAGVRLCLELEPGSAAFNVSTVERILELASCFAVNVDPSHFFWQQIDPLAAIERLGHRIGFAHGKDTVVDAERARLDGVLDRTTWRYATVGHGHEPGWWATFATALETAGYDGVISIEHEDDAVTPEVGIAESAHVLAEATASSRVTP